MPRPWGPRDAGGNDLLVDRVRSNLGVAVCPIPDATNDFVDDWDLYHVKMGEVHCGVNVRRLPDEDFALWWKKWGRTP
jgi:protein-arginine deiminase